MQISHIDHLVLTVRDISATAAFYEWVLGLDVREYQPNRFAIFMGNQKINLHPLGREFNPHPKHPTIGAGDLCLIATTPIGEIIQQLERAGVQILLGPVRRQGAAGMLESVYIHDPDENLIELANVIA